MGLFVKRTETGIAHGFYVLQTGKTRLIVGLGNVGDDYNQTRHNIGFAVLDALAEKLGAGWTAKKTLKCQLAETRVGEQKVILAKPTTMMNLSGEAVAAIQRFYKLKTADTLVIYDDIDLPFGNLRVRVGGGSGGHNGIKSLLAHGGDNFSRLRIGIANEHREKTDTADFVLAKFSKAEQKALETITPKAISKTEAFIAGQLEPHTEAHE